MDVKETFLVFASFFCGIVKLICELRHTFFYKSTARAKIKSAEPSALFYKNLRSAAGKFAHSAVSGNTYASSSSMPLLKKKKTQNEL